MIKLVTYPPAFGEPSGSPFGVKVVCLLNMSAQEWLQKNANDPRKTPKGKFPLLNDNGTEVVDSDVIREYLENTYGIDFDKGLSDVDRATSRAVIRMIEEHTYFALVCERWQKDENWAQIKEAFFGHFSGVMMRFVTPMVRKGAIKQVIAQGMGRHSFKEQSARVVKDIDAIEVLLGDKAFLFGDEPTAADASVVPVLRSFLTLPNPSAASERVKNSKMLMDYLDRGYVTMYLT